MAQETINQIVVVCAAHSGYRRAGVALNQGRNLFDADTFTQAQLAMLEGDPRLEVFEEGAPSSSGSSGQEKGLLEPNGVPTSLVDAIKRLNPDDKNHFTNSGKPQTDALSTLMEAPVSAVERDSAWDEFKASQEQGE